MAIDPGRVKALFQAAIELEEPTERRAFLDREVGGDAALNDRLEALLAVYDRPPAVLDRSLDGGPHAAGVAPDVTRPVSASSADATGPDGPTASHRKDDGPALVDSVIAGRYKLRQQIGEGGMGTVFFAEQTQPVKRHVALKLIKPGMDSRTVLARFESERQALALMDHPNIAKLLDAGTTEQGRPFFVMELVKGIPLTDYCDRHRLGLPERLALFRQICSAVQHAHQKGIIHRDLKPSNILVESHDDKPLPKVIDFGLAKATSGTQLSEHSLFTAFGSVTGTPLYMAPEQATFNALDVDTRADIYALGVILYELLAGSRPIQRDTIKRTALDEMLRVIREVEPPTPSSRISTSDRLPSLAANRHVEPARLSRLVKGDLDWIVMKALAKERNRRYDSAIGLANDVERYLNHEPVTAGPPTAAYRVRKFVRRNRLQVTAALLVLLTLVVGVVGTTLGLLESRRQERRARAQEQFAAALAAEKEMARQAEAEQRAQAEKRLAQVAKMNDILGSIFRDLDPNNATKDGKPLAAILGERLDRATAEIEGEATGDPLAVARMQMALGTSQRGLGYAVTAIGLLAKARATFAEVLGPDHPDTLTSMQNLATSYFDAGQKDRALKLREETLAQRKAKLGPDHLDTLKSMSNLALSYADAGQKDRALKLREEVLPLQRARLGPDHPDTLKSMTNLALSYSDAGQEDRALKLREEVLALQRARLGPDHPDTLLSINNLAGSYFATGRLDRAIQLGEEALALRRAKLGPDHPDTLSSMSNLAVAYFDSGQRDRATKLSEEALAFRRARLGPDHPDTLLTMNNLAQQLQTAGDFDRAEPLWDAIVAARRRTVGDAHPTTLAARLDRADLDLVRGRLGAAETAYRALLAEYRVKLGTDHANTAWAELNLAQVLEKRGDPAAAVPLFRAAVDRARRDQDHRPTLGQMLANLGSPLLATKSWVEAEAVYREALAIREAGRPDHWTTFNTRAKLGAALLGQQKFTEAEPLLRAGYDGMKARADTIPPQGKPRLAEALECLITLAEAAGKADDVKAWKAERAKLDTAKTAPKAESAKR